MGLRTKIFLPLLFLGLLLASYIYAFWLPQLLARAENAYQASLTLYLDSVVEGLVPLLLGKQLDSVYGNLDSLFKKNREWVGLELLDPQGRLLYPLAPTALTSRCDVHNVKIMKRDIRYLDTKLGTLVTRVCFSERLKTIRATQLRLFSILAMISALIIITTGYVLDLVVRRPLRLLAEASQRLAEGDSEIYLPGISNDEVGMLIQSFAKMRNIISLKTKKLIETNEELGHEVERRRKAEEALQEFSRQLEVSVAERTGELQQEVAEHKVTAAENRRLNEELSRQVRELQEARILAEAGVLARGEFLANMSHELSTPLNSIIGFSQVLLGDPDGSLSKQQYEYLQAILQGGQRLNEIQRAILNVAGLKSGEIKLLMASFFLKDLLQFTCQAWYEKAAKQGITLTLEMDIPPETEIEADFSKLQQVMDCLLDNAVKFTPAGGSVRVTARLTNDERTRDEGREGMEEKSSFVPVSKASGRPSSIEITVADTGIGINEEEMPRVFQSFQQLESPYTKRYRGTGIGLFLAETLVELHGGRIWVKSEPGSGSTFTFVLPLRYPCHSPCPPEKDEEFPGE